MERKVGTDDNYFNSASISQSPHVATVMDNTTAVAGGSDSIIMPQQQQQQQDDSCIPEQANETTAFTKVGEKTKQNLERRSPSLKPNANQTTFKGTKKRYQSVRLSYGASSFKRETHMVGNNIDLQSAFRQDNSNPDFSNVNTETANRLHESD